LILIKQNKIFKNRNKKNKNKKQKKMEFLVAAAPAILTSSTQFSSHVRKEQQNAGKNVPSRPPRITFSIVWICLYILMFITFLLV
jgi:tryptophan-rich sensory protein